MSNVETSIVGPATDATSITVLEGVDKCEILISPEYIDANVLFTIPLAPFTGKIYTTNIIGKRVLGHKNF